MALPFTMHCPLGTPGLRHGLTTESTAEAMIGDGAAASPESRPESDEESGVPPSSPVDFVMPSPHASRVVSSAFAEQPAVTTRVASNTIENRALLCGFIQLPPLRSRVVGLRCSACARGPV